jgi:hypothetical protein
LLSAPDRWKKHSFFDKEQKLLSIQTSNREQYTIDVTTGEFVKGTNPKIRFMISVFGVSLLILIIIFVYKHYSILSKLKSELFPKIANYQSIK